MELFREGGSVMRPLYWLCALVLGAVWCFGAAYTVRDRPVEQRTITFDAGVTYIMRYDGHWRQLDEANEPYALIDDTTGAVLVYPKGATCEDVWQSSKAPPIEKRDFRCSCEDALRKVAGIPVACGGAP